jgi:hypothetical protein
MVLPKSSSYSSSSSSSNAGVKRTRRAEFTYRPEGEEGSIEEILRVI